MNPNEMMSVEEALDCVLSHVCLLYTSDAADE